MGHAVAMSDELVGGVAGGSAQRKYEDLSRSWRRSMRKRFWVMGGVMAPMGCGLRGHGRDLGELAVGKRLPDWLLLRDVRDHANVPTRMDREMAGRRVG